MRHNSSRCLLLLAFSILLWSSQGSPGVVAARNEDLVDALIAAKTEVERAALLDANRELVTADLQKQLLARGDGFLNQRQWPKASGAYEAMREVAARLTDKSGVALALNKIGTVFFMQNRFEQALGYYQQSLTLRKELDDKSDIVRSLTNMAMAHLRLSNSYRALEYLEEAYPMLAAVQDKAAVANTLNALAQAYRQIGNYTAALSYYQQAFSGFEATGNQSGVAGTQLNIGNIYLETGDYDQARDYFQRVHALSEAQGNKPLMASAQNNIGNTYFVQGNYGKAMELYEKSRRLKEELKDERAVAFTLANIGNIYHRQANYAQALSHYQKCLEMQVRMGDKQSVADLLSSIGEVYSDQGDDEQAAANYRRSLQIGEEIKSDAVIARALKKLGNVYLRQGRRAEALAAFQRSLSLDERIGAKREIAEALTLIAQCHIAENRPEEGLKVAERSSALAKEIDYLEAQQEALTLMGKTYTALGLTDKARQAFVEAIGLIETLRAQAAGGEQEQQRLFETGVSPYYALVRLLASQNKSAEALAYAERAKARALLDVLSSGRPEITKAITSAEREQGRGLRIEMSSLNAQLRNEVQTAKPDQSRLSDLHRRRQKARLDYEAFQTSLYAAHPELRMHRGEMQPVGVEEAADLLPDARSALLEYVVTDEATYLFVLTKSELKSYTLPINRADLNRQVADFHGLLAQRKLEFQAPARRLYDLLLKPAQAQLRGKTALVIAPDGALWELPFQSLLTGTNRYLLEECAIAYAPSLTALREMTAQRKKRATPRAGEAELLAFGNPALGAEVAARASLVQRGGSFEPLPEAEREVNTLAQLYGATRSRVYVGAEAREDRAKIEGGKYRVLHFATHAVLNDAAPLYSHLMLTPGDGNEDGLLEAWELMEMDMRADLVVLSACETGRGRVGAGEGMIGLSWALFVAGSPATLVSQWKVESVSTTKLMLEFHRNLTRSGLPRARALQAAAKKMMRVAEHRHPYYWAGFVLVGEGM